MLAIAGRAPAGRREPPLRSRDARSTPWVTSGALSAPCACAGGRGVAGVRRQALTELHQNIGTDFSQRVFIIFRRLFLSIILPVRRPTFSTKGWALKILDRNNRHKIIDNVLGTARDNAFT